MTERSNPNLWKKIISNVKKGTKGGNSGQWSARKAQLAVKLYKSKGGLYKGNKSNSNSLTKWTKQKWRTLSGNPSLKTGERYLPSDAIKSLTKEEYNKTSLLKRLSMKKGIQYSKQPSNISKKIRKYRK